MLDVFNVIVSEVCHLLDQSANTVFLAVASVLGVKISVAITPISAVKEEEQYKLKQRVTGIGNRGANSVRGHGVTLPGHW